MIRTKVENMILKTALERAGKFLTYKPFSTSNELHGLAFFACTARAEGMVSDRIFDDIDDLVNAIRPVDISRSIAEMFEMITEEGVQL